MPWCFCLTRYCAGSGHIGTPPQLNKSRHASLTCTQADSSRRRCIDRREASTFLNKYVKVDKALRKLKSYTLVYELGCLRGVEERL
jgi:hypothetical protein